MKFFLLSSFILAGGFSANFVFAAHPSDVVINEIAWMGTESSYTDEWIELRNNTDLPIDLASWTLKAIDGTPEINLTGLIPAKGFYLLERSKNYTGALNNEGENLELYDNTGNLIDSVNCSSQWLAGNNQTKQTMERISSNWQNSQNPGGTPKAKNSEGVEVKPQENKPYEVEPREIEEPEESPTSFIVLLTAVIIAVFSGVIILILKRKLKLR